MIRTVYEVDPLICPRCGGTMKVIPFRIDYAVADRIIDHLKLTFVAERPPPPQIAYQEVRTSGGANCYKEPRSPGPAKKLFLNLEYPDRLRKPRFYWKISLQSP